MSPHPPHADQHNPPPPRRRWLLPATIIAILLVLILTPPFLNVSRLRLRIASNISASIGRPVHIDDVTLHLLPMPGFTLKNLVVSEDPAFGSEPVIRAAEVVATIRVSSLWRRRVEFSTIRFVESGGEHPSLNIVRNAQGRWNLQDILLQVAHTAAAPTAQRKAGPAPRFPYIEATGARINLKLGDEKMPFSLTETDFALWLPSAEASTPESWHIRLQGKPARTDTNASDTGDVRLDGTLGRASKLADVPLNLSASWANSQMGEASLLFTGEDSGWRGQVEAGATLTGPLGAATLATDIHLTDLRRDDFVPAKLLDISAHCTAAADLTIVTLTRAACTLPDGGPEPITITSAAFDLQHPAQAPAAIAFHQMPLAFAFDVARVFSQRIPPDLQPSGTINAAFERDSPIDPATGSTLSGTLQATLLPAPTADAPAPDLGAKPGDPPKGAILFTWLAQGNSASEISLQLQPTVLHPGGTSLVVMTADMDLKRYLIHLNGNLSAPQLLTIANLIPPLGDGVSDLFSHVTDDTIHPVDLTCTRTWNDGVQACTTAQPAPKPRH